MGRKSHKHEKQKAQDGDGAVDGIEIFLKRAEGLPAADSTGKSDPFVIVKIHKEKWKSKMVKQTLDPDWQETGFVAASLNTSHKMVIDVYDWDRMSANDYLGSLEVDVSHLDDDGSEMVFDGVKLTNKKTKQPAGKIWFTLKRATKSVEQLSKKEKKRWASSGGKRKVVVELIEGRELLSMDSNGFSDPYVVMKLNKVKHTSSVKTKTLDPKWRERFEFPWEEGKSSMLEIKVWDRDLLSRDDLMGELTLDMETLQPRVVNERWHEVTLNGGPGGYLHMLITIIDQGVDMVLTKEQKRSVAGTLQCHIIQATGLAKADTFSLSDPYVELTLGNARLRTQVIDNTLDPVWDRVLELPVNDIFECLDLTVYDEDKGSKPDFLGKIVVPLLEIKNGETRWFSLKSSDMMRRSKGEIQVAFNFSYQPIKGYMSLIKRKEVNHMARHPPFSLKRMRNAIERLNAVGMIALDGALLANDLFNWDLGILPSIGGMVVWTLATLLFRIWQIPLFMLLAIIVQRVFNYKPDVKIEVNDKGLIVTKANDNKNNVLMKNLAALGLDADDEDGLFEDDDDEDDGDLAEPEGEEGPMGSVAKSVAKKKKGKKSRQGLMAQIKLLRQIGQQVQDILEFVASLGERFQNLGNWSVPLITQLVCVGLFFATIVTLIIPFNVLVCLYGNWRFIKKAYRKYIKPRSKFHVPIIEGIELLKRVPSDVEKVQRAPLPGKRLSVKKSGKLSAFSRLNWKMK